MSSDLALHSPLLYRGHVLLSGPSCVHNLRRVLARLVQCLDGLNIAGLGGKVTPASAVAGDLLAR